MSKKPKLWTMPPWMEPYRKLISNTGGNPIEELMNDHTTTIFENAPRAMLCIAVQDQVGLLTRLRGIGALTRHSHPKGSKAK